MIVRSARHRSSFILVMAVAVFLPIMAMRAEADDSAIYEFLKRVACGLLHLDIQCDFLSAENARNIFNAKLALLSQKLCGSINRAEAKQLLESGNALLPKVCKELLELWK